MKFFFQSKKLANLFFFSGFSFPPFFFFSVYLLGPCYTVDLCSSISVLGVSNPGSATQKWNSFIMVAFLGINPTKSPAYGDVDGMTHMHKIIT